MKKIFSIIVMLAASLAVLPQTYTGKNRQNTGDKLNNEYCTGLFKTADGTILDMADENAQGYINILDWIEGRVAGLRILVLRNGNRIPVIRGTQAKVYVDEMPVDASLLNFIAVNDIAMIKVIKGPFAAGIGNSGGGAIAIYTTRAEEEQEE